MKSNLTTRVCTTLQLSALLALTACVPKGTHSNLAQKSWIIGSQSEWNHQTASRSNLEYRSHQAHVIADQASFKSTLKRYQTKRSAASITIDQSPVWHNWHPMSNIGPSNLGDAPIMLTVAPGDYWMFGRYHRNQETKNFQAEAVKLKGYDLPLLTTPFPNQYDAPGGLKKKLGGYHAWQSKDMKHWVHHGPVSELFSVWATTAEYVDGKLYLYYDFPNDQDPHLYIDDDLTDGLPGKNMGLAFKDPSDGSDCTFIRDLDGNFHVIYEDWSPIDASRHSWDSPLAGHAVSSNGIDNFKILNPAVDERTQATGTFGEYPHPHWCLEDPKNFPGKPSTVDIKHLSVKKGDIRAFAQYEIHEPKQDAFGDWASICIGGQYYLFGDYHAANAGIRVGWFTASSLDEKFEFCGAIGQGHPDPDIMFAEGKFYMATQMAQDYVSTGPWVGEVKVRVGVDTNNDGKINTWTNWQLVQENYDYITGFSKQIAKTPAQMDLRQLPDGYGFQIELDIKNTGQVANSIIDRIQLDFHE